MCTPVRPQTSLLMALHGSSDLQALHNKEGSYTTTAVFFFPVVGENMNVNNEGLKLPRKFNTAFN